MAYDQGNYQQNQRPYNGRAAQRPGPPQSYNQAPPPQRQQYPPQQFDQYPQDDHGYNDYDNGYAQNYDDGYGNMNNGGRGNGHAQQQGQNYLPPPEFYGDDRGGMRPPQSRGPPPQQRGPPMPMDNVRRNDFDQRGPPPPPPQQQQRMPLPKQRPPMDGYDRRGGSGGPPGPQRPPQNVTRDNFDQRGPAPQGGFQNGPPQGRGGPERNGPGPGQQAPSRQGHRPLKSPPLSPEYQSWDNPFPTFPGAKKKTSVDEEKNIMQKMGNLNMNAGPDQRQRPAVGPVSQGDFAPPSRAATFENRPASRSGNRGDFPPPSRAATFDDRPRASLDSQRRPAPANEFTRPSLDQQRSGGSGNYPLQQQQPPAQNFSQPKKPQPLWNQSAAFGNARNKAYWDPPLANGDNFGPPSRSNTMPNDFVPPSINQPQHAMEDPGMSAPYNGFVGRNMPPRPSTATGTRNAPSQQSQYVAPTPIAPQQAFVDNFDEHDPRRSESISELYDSYYDEQDRYEGQRHSGQSAIANFDSRGHGQNGNIRGDSNDLHMNSGPVHQQGGYQRPVQQHTNHQALAEPQAAVFESASDGQQTPTNANFFQRDQYDDYGAPSNQYDRPRSKEQYDPRGPPQRGNQFNQPSQGQYDQGYPVQRAPSQNSYNEPPQNGFQPPPRSTSAAPRMGQGPPFNNPPPPVVGPKPDMNSGYGNPPMNGGYSNQPMNGGMQRNPSAGSNHSIQQPYNNDPSHPVPVRPGLIPGSVASQNANIKPIPVRNYNNTNGPAGVNVQPAPQPQQQQQPQPQPQQQPPPKQAAAPQQPQGLTQSELEHIRKAANAKPNDAALQMLLIKKLVEASEVLVNSYPDVRMRNKMREKYVMDASKMLKRLVAGNNTDAMFYLADCYGRGALGLESNDKEAFNLYQSAAKAGHAAAAYRTAVCCELGSEDGGGTKKDPLKAIQWYKRSATLGDTPAMYKMGMIQLKGLLGQPKNIKEAIQWLKRAAERADAENPHALHELGLLYEAPQSADGSIVRDESYSLKLFKQAADLGYKFSQFRLGCAYEYGLFGLAIDARQSIAWYSRAAVQEEHQSELALSGWYLTGSEGVLQQSDTEAYLWARKAAMAGLAKAEYAMGYFTEVGIGSQANLEDAKRWYWRAAAQNFPKARERLEDLKKNGGKGGARPRERISRSKVGKHNEGECAVM